MHHCRVQHRYEKTDVQIAEMYNDDHRIAHLKQFLTEIWNAKEEAERICANKETLTQWVEELVAAHPDEAEYWVLATDLDNQLGLTRASVAVELPVQVVQVENDRNDENEQNNENELDLLVQEVEMKVINI